MSLGPSWLYTILSEKNIAALNCFTDFLVINKSKKFCFICLFIYKERGTQDCFCFEPLLKFSLI